jgi:hypothetical protein
MAIASLKSLHAYIRLFENASEMKRRMPASSSQKTIKEGLSEMSKLVGIDPAAFKDPQNIAAVIGAQRFVMIWGEVSVTDHVARVFDSSKVLLTVLIEPPHFVKPSGYMGATPGIAHPPSNPASPPNNEPETALDSLKPLLSGNSTLTCRLFRSLFEHMLGFVPQSSVQQENALLINELTGKKEHSRSFLSTVMFILGAEVDYEHLLSFMMEQGLFGMQIFEYLLQNRDYCDAYYAFRKLERAFRASPAEEETRLRNRMDKFNAQYGGKPCGAKIFEADEQNKARIDAHLAAADVLEAMAFTPWCMSLNHAVSAASSNCIQSLKTIAGHFESFADRKETKEQANREIADHLIAFARQFSADSKAASLA